jgi:hypothetical protein
MKDLDNIYTYHKPSALQNMKYDMIRAYAKQLADAIETVCPDSRERSLAHTNLEQATMWANASIARNGDPEPVVSPFDAPHRTIQKVARDYPPDVFDFVETGEMVEREPEPKKQTNFSELTKSSESLAEFLSAQPYCGRGEVVGGCNEDCYPCVLKWLNEEVKADD